MHPRRAPKCGGEAARRRPGRPPECRRRTGWRVACRRMGVEGAEASPPYHAAGVTRAQRPVLPAGGPQATHRALARAADASAVVLVEGYSDQIAVETLAARQGRDLAQERVLVVPIGGAQAIGRFLTRFAEAKVAGLCDVGEEEVFRRGLEHAGYGSNLSRAEMERLGFFVCVVDLEDEL